VLWAQGQCGVDGVMVSGTAWGAQRRGLGDDDGVVRTMTSPTWVMEDRSA
jgi:hypothetical protein